MAETQYKEIIKDYGLKPATQRDLSLLSLSCIGQAYTRILREKTGLDYKALAGVGQAGKWHSMLNEASIIEQTKNIVIKCKGQIEKKILEPINSLFKKTIDKIEELKKSMDKNPEEFLIKFIKIIPDYLACLGLYNCFWRYIGDGSNTLLTKEEIKIIGENRDKIARVYPDYEKLVIQTTNKIGEKYGFEGDLIRYFSFFEILAIKSFNLTKIELDKLSKRREKYWYAYVEKDNREIIIDDKEVISEIEKSYFTVEGDKVTELRGQPAFKGIVTGRAYRHDRIDKNSQPPKEDFVLVTVMTHPNDIAIISKAKAIVTDEGGLLCHAAIISRELGIPAVIGTKIATKILKDGDLVEVDANIGIVRIIKKRG